jgi:CDP-glucose 4,6-dehydratase
MFKDFYKDKTVLVTGSTGFKGSWLCLWLHSLGAHVIGFALAPPTEPNLFSILDLGNFITNIEGDIRDENSIEKLVRKYKPEIIFHLAAQSLLGVSYSKPKLTYETNIMGTVNLIETIRKSKSVSILVNITSDKCYENKGWYYGYREEDQLGGYDPYSSSKGCVELITAAYRKSFFETGNTYQQNNVAIASARAGNVIGGGDWAENRLVPDCIRYLINDDTIPLRDPLAIRPWQYVLEPLSGYLWLGLLLSEDKEKYSSGWNFGPGETNILTVEELTKYVIELWGNGNYKTSSKDTWHESKLLRLDISKSIFLLKWKPVFDVHEAITETINWYKKYYNDGDMFNYSLEQIKKYIKKARELRVAWSKRV